MFYSSKIYLKYDVHKKTNKVKQVAVMIKV